jgi:hypothetical protein
MLLPPRIVVESFHSRRHLRANLDASWALYGLSQANTRPRHGSQQSALTFFALEGFCAMLIVAFANGNAAEPRATVAHQILPR